MKKLFTLLTFAIFTFKISANNPSTTIATWKNDAKGAYSFIHDDYGDNSVIGINNYADTIARNRGIKFTIGAITSACEANPQMWTDAIDMINYGHEIINHTHNHYCAIRADSWCTTGLWAETATQDFATEMTYSSNLITTKTGTTPRYFIYPYDLYNEAANDHLKSLNYIGARTGARDENPANFSPDAEGFFRTAFYVKTQDNNGDVFAADLNYWADQASANNAWVNREMHNVGPTGWGHIEVSDYRDHLNHLQSEIAANNLWVGTISEVLTYQIQKLNYTPNTSYSSSANEIIISFNTPSFDVSSYLAPLSKKSPVTLLIDLDGIDVTGMIAKQGNNTLSEVSVSNGIMKINAYPSEGSIVIGTHKCIDFCLVEEIQDSTVDQGNDASFSIKITSTPTVTYAWYFNDNLIGGETGSTLTLTNVQSSQAGTYKVVASKTGQTDITSTAILTVHTQTPYNNTIAGIPGVIQFENFDVGGQGVSFNESTPTNQGGSNYRTEPVDIETKWPGGYKLGYCMTGEWLEYTVDIAEHAIYDLDVNNASEWAGGGFKLSLDGVEVSPSLTFSPTGSWTTWQTNTFNNITLTKGQHILRVTMTSAETDFDWMEFKINKIITDVESSKLIESEVVIFPNPFNYSFTIDASNQTLTEISIMNITGKKVFQSPIINGKAILAENLIPGVYILEYSINNRTVREKIVKK